MGTVVEQQSKPPAPPLGQTGPFRVWYRQHARPRRYFPLLHVLVHVACVLGGSAFALSRVRDGALYEWLTIPFMLIVGSLFVYFFHRDVLHRPRGLLRMVYVIHTLQHHRFFDYDAITRDERDDLHIMLFPWWAGLIIVPSSFGAALALSPIVGPNIGYLTMFMAVLYFGLYELVHTVSHLPNAHPLARLPVLGFLREHHRLHHDPALMGKHNFNVVLPLFDWLLGALVTRRQQAQ